MKQAAICFLIFAFSTTGAFAQTCESKAVGSDGRPLAGAAKTSFMTKCKKDAAAACETKAVGSDGKKLAGAAKTSFVKKCQSES